MSFREQWTIRFATQIKSLKTCKGSLFTIVHFPNQSSELTSAWWCILSSTTTRYRIFMSLSRSFNQTQCKLVSSVSRSSLRLICAKPKPHYFHWEYVWEYTNTFSKLDSLTFTSSLDSPFFGFFDVWGISKFWHRVSNNFQSPRNNVRIFWMFSNQPPPRVEKFNPVSDVMVTLC